MERDIKLPVNAMKMNKSSRLSKDQSIPAESITKGCAVFGERNSVRLNCQQDFEKEAKHVDVFNSTGPEEYFAANVFKGAKVNEDKVSQRERARTLQTGRSGKTKEPARGLATSTVNDVGKDDSKSLKNKRYDLQASEPCTTVLSHADLLQSVGLCRKIRSPAEINGEKDAEPFTDHKLCDVKKPFHDFLPSDLFLNTSKNSGYTQTVSTPDHNKGDVEKHFKEWPTFLMLAGHKIDQHVDIPQPQTDGKDNPKRLKMSKEGTIRVRNRKCSRPKRVASRGDREVIKDASFLPSQELENESTAMDTSVLPSQNQSANLNKTDNENVRSLCFAQPKLLQLAHLKNENSKDQGMEEFGAANDNSHETQCLICPSIKKEAFEEAYEIHFSASKDSGKKIVGKKSSCSQFPKNCPNEMEWKAEPQSMEDTKTVKNIPQGKLTPIRKNHRTKTKDAENAEHNNLQSLSHYYMNTDNDIKIEPEKLLPRKLSPNRDAVYVGDCKRWETREVAKTCQKEESATTHVKEENTQEYELDHWCDLGPSSTYTGIDSFDGKDEKEESPKSFNTHSKTHTYERDTVNTLNSMSLPHTNQFSYQSAQRQLSFASPNSAFHKPIKRHLEPTFDLQPASFFPTSKYYSYGDKHSQNVCHFDRTPYIPGQFNPQHLAHSQFSSQAIADSTTCLANLSPPQRAQFNSSNALCMYPQFTYQTPPYGIYQYPYFAMIPDNQSNWNPPKHPQSVAQHQNTSVFRQQEYSNAKAERTSVPTKTSKDFPVSQASTIPERSTDTCYTATTVEKHAFKTNSTSMSCQIGLDNFSLRSSNKTRQRKRNEDFLDPTAMRFGFDDDEDSNDIDVAQVASDDEWRPDQGQDEGGHVSDSELDDEDDENANALRTQSKRNGLRYRNRIDPENSLRNTANLIEVLKEPQGNIKKCPTCGKLCKGNYQLRRHQMSHSELRPYQCSQCDKGFKQKAHLKGHLKSVHSKTHQIKLAKTQGSKKKNKENREKDTVQFHCSGSKDNKDCNVFECKEDKNYSCNPENPEAQVKENAVKEVQDKSSIVKPRTKRVRLAAVNRDFSCHICAKGFKTAYRLKRHEQSHTDVRPYACQTCGKRFKQSGHRNEHEANHQRQGIRFLCNQCGVVFRCRSSFNSHMRAHGQELTRQGEPATGSSKADRHEQSGSSETPEAWEMASTAYDCPYCIEKFATAQALNNHLDSHVEVMHRRHVQPYNCDICRRAFTYRHNLMKHSLMHKAPEKFADFFKEKMEAHVASGKPSYKCSHCSKVFIRKETLAKHTKIHTGLKPFKCAICSQSFTQNIHLKVHMRKHTGSRPFQCRECGKGFIDSTALAKHIEYEACNSENSVYYCKLCDKRHYYLGSIKQHIRKDHNIQQNDLAVHIKKAERPIKLKADDCTEADCGVQKRQERVLRYGGHKCLICSRIFKEKAYLLRHFRRQHKQLLNLLNSDQCEGNIVSKAPITRKGSEAIKDSAKATSPSESPPSSEATDFVLRTSCTSSISDCDILSEPKPLVIDVKDCTKTTFTQEYSKPIRDQACLNSELNHQDGQCTSQIVHQPFSTTVKNQTNPDESVNNAAGVGTVSTCVNKRVLHVDTTAENIPEQPKEINAEDQGRTLDNFCDRETEPNADTSTDALSPSENFLYKIGLTVSRKGKRSTNPPPSSETAHSKNDKTENENAVLTEPEISYTELVNEASKKSSKSYTHQTFGKSQEMISENISVLELDAKQLYCKDGFTGESFVVDLNELDVSANASTNRPGVHRADLKTADSLKEKVPPSLTVSVKSKHGKTSKRSPKVCKTTQNLPDKRITHNISGSPTPLDLSLRHLRAKPAQEKTPFTGHSKTTPRKESAFAYLAIDTKDKYRCEPPTTGQIASSKTQPNKSKQIKANTGFGFQCVIKQPTTESPVLSTKSRKYYVHVPSTTSPKTAKPNTFAPAGPYPSEAHFQNRAGASFPEEREQELKEKPIDLSNYTRFSGVSSYGTVTPAAQSPSYSTPQYPTVLGITGTSLLPPDFSQWTTRTSDMHVRNEADTQSYWKAYRSLPSNYSASSCFSQSHARTSIGFTSPSQWAHCGYASSNATDFDHSDSYSSWLGSGHRHRSPTTSTKTVSIPETTETGVRQTAQQSPPSLPDSTMKTGLGFNCENCGKSFNARHRLKRHELTHTDFRPYSCPQCGRAFRQKIHLSDHMKRHAGHRPFSCSGCGKKFILKNEMNQHVKHYCYRVTAVTTAAATTVTVITTATVAGATAAARHSTPSEATPSSTEDSPGSTQDHSKHAAHSSSQD